VKFARYFVVGGIAAIVDFSVFGLLLLALGSQSWFAANAMSFVVATVVNYVLSIRFVFSSGARFSRTNEMLLVFLVSLIGLGVNQSAMWFFYRVAGWHLWLAKCGATGVALAWNFTARKHFVFRER
jgi:putative flippase GtrA